MAEIVEYPQPEYVLRCQYCGNHSFFIYLNSPDNEDYKEYECTNQECGAVFTFSEIECEVG